MWNDITKPNWIRDRNSAVGTVISRGTIPRTIGFGM
jgi:hypothetical protein